MSMRWSVAFCVGVLASGCSLLTSLDDWTFAEALVWRQMGPERCT